MLKDVLLDVVKHTNGLGFIEAVKIEGTTSETSISAMDLAQEKINMYLSDGFEFWFTQPVVAEGQQIGRIVWLGKTQEERMQ